MPRDTIDRILDPNSVAVVGASEDETKRGYQVLESLEADGYDGDVYAVNPNRETVLGRTAYPSVTAIGEPVDLALVATPAGVVPSVLEGCAGADLAGAVVLAVGFGETNQAGNRLEAEIVDLARRYDVRLVGPNTSGLINVHRGCNLVGADAPPGSLALLCQSGNIAIDAFTAAEAVGGGFSHYVGVGNEADLRFDEYLPHFARAPETDAVLVYVEGYSDGRAFLDAAREVTPEMPIVALKGGRTDAGQTAANSHTGAMAGDSRITDGVFRQAGVVTVDRSDELVAVGQTLADQPTPDGPNVAVLADGGGHGTLAADALTERGLTLPSLDDDTTAALDAVLPGAASVTNPVDVAGGTDDDQTVFAECASALVRDPNVDVLVLTGLFGGYGIRFAESYAAVEEGVAARLADLAEDTDTPIVVHSVYEGYDSPAHETLREAGVPVRRSLDVATACVEALVEYGSTRARQPRGDETPSGDRVAPTDGSNESAIVSNAVDAGIEQLSEYDSRRVLQDYDVPLTPARLATTAADAGAAFEAFDGPVAMKVVSRDVVHKTDVGGVTLDVASVGAARDAFAAIQERVASVRPDAGVDGVLVSPMRQSGTELVVGAVESDQFGPVAMVGPGGVFVEVLDDVSFRALPFDAADARDMLASLDAQALLDGARGAPPVDREAVVDLLLAVSRLVAENPAIAELDLNPVLATEDGVEALDASITLEQCDDARRSNSRNDYRPTRDTPDTP